MSKRISFSADGQQVRTTKTEEDERGGRKPTPVLYHGGKFDLSISTHTTLL
ncbi:hypothetical protein VCRA2119O125_120171 [Vibrio crassostreae]|nr:hypothetical protein VCRA2110O113_130169 [Vibrio crassostreae]CAK2615774.1 hypothetical protein VCRA2119O125_120171 [Vibrio crassostreae]